MRGVQLAMLAPATTGFSVALSTPIVKQTSPIESAIQRTNDSLGHEPNTQGGEKSLKIHLPYAPVSCVTGVRFGGYLLPLTATQRVKRFLEPAPCAKAGGL
jgi:hypothetical protein